MKMPWQTAIFVILVSACVVEAQVTPTQGGRAMDANYLIGGRGLNTIRYRTDRFDSNLYVTGQVTGGFHFRGRQPYAGADQLRIDLPSGGMDDFHRGSVGLQQVLSGVSYGPNRYFSLDRTVLSAGAIAEGLNAPGTSIPRATYLPAMSARRLYDSAINAYKPALPDVGRQLMYNPLIQPNYVGGPIQGAAGVSAQRFDRGAVRPAASDLFGILRESDQQRLVDELAEAQIAHRAGRIESRAEERIQPVPDRTGPKKPDDPTTPEAEPEPPRLKRSAPDQDVFVDILMAMEEMRAEAAERSRRQDRTKDQRPETKIILPDDPDTPDAGDDIDDVDDVIVPARPTGGTAVRKVRNTIVLSKLAGMNRDLFNLNMSRAEKKLAEGEYYAAVGCYDVAGILNRGNPLAPLGAALALFAADEPLSASFRLRKAMKRFPPLMETRVDVKLILGKSIVEMRIGQLEHRLADEDEPAEPALVFLTAFIRSSMAQPAKAAKHAETLKKIAGKEKIYHLYADHLIKAASPSTQPATSKGRVP